MAVIFSQTALILSFFVPFCAFSQQFSQRYSSPNPKHSRENIGLSVRKASFRRIAPNKFSAPILSVPLLPLHLSPSEELFINEMAIGEGSSADMRSLYETRKNLLQTGLFSRIDIFLDNTTTSEEPVDYTDVRLFLYERQQFSPFFYVESGGSAMDLGIGMTAVNIGQKGITLKGRVHHREENTIGWQARFDAEWNISETAEQQPLLIRSSAWVNRLNYGVETGVIAPFSDIQPYNEWSVRLSYFGGQEFFYFPTEISAMLRSASFRTTPFSSFRFHSTGIISGSYWGTGFYLSGTVQVDLSQRDSGTFFIRSNSVDNTVMLLAEIGTEKRDAALVRDSIWGLTPTYPTRSLETMIETGFHLQGGIFVGLGLDIPNGVSRHTNRSLGLRILGSSPVYPTGRCVYAALVGEQWYSSLKAEFWGEAPFSLEAKNHFAITNGIVLATRIRGEIANGGVVIVDSDNGVRGYGLNTIIGGFDYWLFNAELRGLHITEFGAYRLSGVLWGDLCSVGGGGGSRANLYQTRGASIGAGLRLHYPSLLSAFADQGVIRLDIAMVADSWRLGQIILSTKEVFSLFDDLPTRQERLIGTRRYVE